MNIIEEAFKGLYPEKGFNYEASVRYSGKFNDYNANVTHTRKSWNFKLSRKWKEVSREIRIGLIQHLILKILKNRKKTVNTDLYDLFIKNVHIAAPKTQVDPVLKESFDRVNDGYFYGMVEMPNLILSDSVNKLGSYEYGSDTITISRMLANKTIPKEVLDYVMYHEMLHKKLKFRSGKGRSHHHTPEFKKAEKSFRNAGKIEKELDRLVRKHKFKRMFGLY